MTKAGYAHDHPLFITLLFSSSVSVVLLLIRIVSGGTWRYSYLAYNLLLAWLPLLFARWLNYRLRSTRWFSGWNIILTILCLGFLPNTFYILSDFVHLQSTGEISLLFDIVMYASFTWNGFLLGFLSLVTIHRQLLKRLKRLEAHFYAGFILLVCSFAIYLGRYLRWNSWDVLINPAGLLFDVTDRIINPAAHPQAFVTTGTFFLLLGSMYMVIWQLAKLAGDAKG